MEIGIKLRKWYPYIKLIILFVGILLLYAINLGDMSLFTDSPFTFLAMFIFYVLF